MPLRSSALYALSFLACAGLAPAHAEVTTETIVLMRHAEKPAGGLGQLDCQGLNRALALPPVIAKLFGKPNSAFAPDPAKRKNDSGVPYDYIRPLATIEPTAIAFGLPVDTSLGFSDIDGLASALDKPDYRTAFVLVAWEHKLIDPLARNLIKAHGGDPAIVPVWRENDYDGLYVVRIVREGKNASVSFERQREGLDGQPEACAR